MIKLLLDMGLPRRASDGLRAEGLDVVHLGALGLARASDTEAIELAVREGRTVVTLDRDFTRLVATSGSRVPSVIFIRRENVDHDATVIIIREVLARCAAEIESGCLVSVTADGIRVRRLPIERVERGGPA